MVLMLAACGPRLPEAENPPFEAAAWAQQVADASEHQRPPLLDGLDSEELAALAEALLELGQARARESDPSPAAHAFGAAREVAEKAQSLKLVGLADLNLGTLYGRRGYYQEARGPLETAVHLFREAGENDRLASALNGLGIVLRNLGHPEEAVPVYRDALQLAGEQTPPVAVAGRLHNLGTAYWEMGELDLALEKLTDALERKRRLDGEAKMCSTLVSLANVRSDRGEEAAAEKALRECIDSEESLGGRLSAMHNLGTMMRRQGRDNEAAEWLEAAHAEAVAAGDARRVLELIQALATLELKRQKPARALELMDAALAAAGDLSDAARPWVFVHLTRAHALGELGRFGESLEAAERAHQLAAGSEIPDVSWQTWHQLGRSRLVSGDRDGAARAFTSAIEIIEAWRRGISRAGERTGFLHRKLAPYHRLLELELERGRGEAALEVAERARARALADVLSAMRPRGVAVPETGTGTWRGTGPLDAAIVAYTVTAKRLWIWSQPIAAADASDEDSPAPRGWRSVAIEQAELTGQVAELRRALAGRDLAFRDRAAELGRLLFDPVAAELEGARRLVVVPDGPLWDVPFATLEIEGEPLIRRFALHTTPSLEVLASAGRRPPSGADSLVVLGGADPGGGDLAGTDPDPGGAFRAGPVTRQARAVAAAHGVEARLGQRARLDQLESALVAGPRLLHVAAHGVADTLHPARSYLQLEPAGQSGRLGSAGLAALELGSVELVLLAACESGRGQVRRGEGMLGLAWATLTAGARNALISHWRVDADATADLMVRLHRRLAAGEHDIAAALRDSMLELEGDPTTSHPFYWGGFTVVGDGRLGGRPLE